MKKIVFYTVERSLVLPSELLDSPSSGTVVALVNLATALSELGDQITVAGCRDSDDKAVPHYKKCEGVLALQALCAKIEPDHVVIVGHAIHSLDAGFTEQFDCTYWMHNWENLQDPNILSIVSACRHIVCVSRYHFAHYYLKNLLVTAIRSKLSYIDNALHTISRTVKEQSSGLSTHDSLGLMLAFVGYPSAEKGFELVIDACRKLRVLSNQSIELHVFGGNDLYNPDAGIERNPNHGEDWVVWHGTVSRRTLYKALTDYDYVFVGLNGSETFCLAALEAIACGVIPVTVSTGGQTSFLNKKNSIITPSAHFLPDVLKRHIRSVNADQSHMHEAGIKLLSNYSSPAIASAWRQSVFNSEKNALRLSEFLAVFWFLFSRVKHRTALKFTQY